MSVQAVTLENFEEEVLKEEKPVLIDFWADWCGPCRMLSPLVDAFAESQDAVKVCKVDVDQQTELSVRYKVMNIPTLLLVKDGEVVKRSVGVISGEEIAAFAQLP